MTLAKQLLLSGLFILLCLFVGMLMFVASNTQTFLNNQLASHSQDTATALGISLTATMKKNDVVTAQRIVDAVWDRGYYESILIESSNGEPIVERKEKVKVYAVPQWFIDHLPLTTEPKEALIMDGWQKVGKVKIQSNPGFAYKQIWSTFLDSSIWLLVTGVIAMILGSVLLFIILKPLRAITSQAVAICNQQFSIQKTLPWTIDLRLVVEAMNNMSLRLKRMFEEQTEISETLRQQAYTDAVSGLGNRRYFDMQFDFILQDIERGTTGTLILIEINQFKEYNDKFGYPKGDELLRNTAKAIREQVKMESALVAHLKGASFAVVLPNKSKEFTQTVVDQLITTFNAFKQKHLSEVENIASIGYVVYETSQSKSEILSRADMALRQAQSKGVNQFAFLDTPEQDVHGAMAWGQILGNVIAQNKIILHFQKVDLFEQPDVKLYETLMRIEHEGRVIPAGVFMPMAERLNYMEKLDQLVIDNVVRKINADTQKRHYAVNISPSSLDSEQFKTNLLQKIKSLGKKASQLIIELPEYGVVNRVDAIRSYFLQLSKLGAKTSIDHYGKSFSAFSYLYNLKLNYLKIDGSFSRALDQHEENQFFVRSLVDIAHSLGIIVIAEAIEQEGEYVVLKQLKVDGAQGYYIAKPQEAP